MGKFVIDEIPWVYLYLYLYLYLNLYLYFQRRESGKVAQGQLPHFLFVQFLETDETLSTRHCKCFPQWHSWTQLDLRETLFTEISNLSYWKKHKGARN